ncbi:MAG: hypothetical protein AB7F65_00425 [Dehalococcoidia bacterium]
MIGGRNTWFDVKKSYFFWPAVFVVAFVGTFLLTRELIDGGGSVTAQSAPSDREPMWYMDEQKADDSLERFDGEMQGIRIAPDLDVSSAVVPCPAGYEQEPSGAPSDNALTPFPPILPPGTELVESIGVSCGADFVSTEASYSVPSDRAMLRLGGGLQVYRFRGEPLARLDAPISRLAEGQVAGYPAVVLRPITDDGYGLSAVIVREDWGLTVVRATGLTENELLRIVESMYQGAAQ